MKVAGREVLYALRDLERRFDDDLAIHARSIAELLEVGDGRAVTRKLQELESVGFVERWPELTLPNWRSTRRGREVERLLARHDAHRGGMFRPTREFIDDVRERLAIS